MKVNQPFINMHGDLARYRTEREMLALAQGAKPIEKPEFNPKTSRVLAAVAALSLVAGVAAMSTDGNETPEVQNTNSLSQVGANK